MITQLFQENIFGPVQSRRLGRSLGINLLPLGRKLCNFDCIYCECGFNPAGAGKPELPSVGEVLARLRERLERMHRQGEHLDSLTFSGNGEPTLHPDFDEAIRGTCALRDAFFPEAAVSVLTNGTRLANRRVSDVIALIDRFIVKLDAMDPRLIGQIDRPAANLNPQKYLDRLCSLGDRIIIQTMFTFGLDIRGEPFDNTTPQSVSALTAAYRQIRPQSIMIYTVSRNTPLDTVQKVPADRMDAIARQIRQAGFDVSVAY